MATSSSPMMAAQALPSDTMDVAMAMSSPSVSSTLGPTPASSTIAAYHQSLAQHIFAILASIAGPNTDVNSMHIATASGSRSRSRSPEASRSRRSTITALPGRNRSRANSLIDPNVLITVAPVPASTSSPAQDMVVDTESVGEGSSAQSIMETATEASSACVIPSVSSKPDSRAETRPHLKGDERRGRSRTRSGPRVPLRSGKESEKQEDYEEKREARFMKRRSELQSTVGSWLEGIQSALDEDGDEEADYEAVPEIYSNVPSPSIPHATLQRGRSFSSSSSSLKKPSQLPALTLYQDPPAQTAMSPALDETSIGDTTRQADVDRTPTAPKAAGLPVNESLRSSSSAAAAETGSGCDSITSPSPSSPYYYFTNTITTPSVTSVRIIPAQGVTQTSTALKISDEDNDDRIRKSCLTAAMAAVGTTGKDRSTAKMSSLTFSSKVCKASFRTCKSPRLTQPQPQPQDQDQDQDKPEAEPQEAVTSTQTQALDSKRSLEEKEWLLNVLASDEWAASVVASTAYQQHHKIGSSIDNREITRTTGRSRSRSRKRSPMRVVVTGEMPTPKAVAVATFWG
ncbi:hypothetical protein IAT40_003514 [Kwoniella sp. CBS 6097]